MEPRECFYHDQFGYCWLERDQWFFQAVDVHEQNVDEPVPVTVDELVFEHDETGQ